MAGKGKMVRNAEPKRDLVDAGSEYSFPASDPPSYMAGTAVAGSPPEEGIHREGVSTELVNRNEGKPSGKPKRGHTDP